jgi:hypothetical protein
MSEELELFDALKAVAEAAKDGDAEIDAARAAVNASEAQVGARIAAVVENVARIVFESNSQVLIKQAVRKLYWETRIKASVIAEAFRINEHAVYTTAGPLIAEIPCDGGCGRTIEQIYSSHSDWKSKGRHSKSRIPDLCADCQAQREALGRVEYEKYVERQQAEAAAYCAQNGHYWGAEDMGDLLKTEWTGSRIANPYIWKTQPLSVLTPTQSSLSCAACIGAVQRLKRESQRHRTDENLPHLTTLARN